MLTKNQADREADRRWDRAQKATYWRGRAQKVRLSASRMSHEQEITAMLVVARDYDFLAEYEEQLSGQFL